MADVIICLGDAFTRQKTIDNMKFRTEKAVALFKKGAAKRIIFTGGFKTRKDLSEARFMADYAVKLGVPRANIIREEKAGTTIGNAYYCNKIMGTKGFNSAIVVTSPHHMMRARYIFTEIIKNKKLVFEKSKSNFGFFDAVLYNLNEIWSLIKIMVQGIDLTKV